MYFIKEKEKKEGQIISFEGEENYMVIHLTKRNKEVVVHNALGERLIADKKATEVKGKKLYKPETNIK